MHPADWKKLRELRPAPTEARPRVEVPKPLARCPLDGTVFPITEGVCPKCGTQT